MTIIYISGIDGCGKTTQSELLVSWLQGQGQSAEYQWLRWEPSILPLINRIRNLAGKPKSASKKEVPRDTKSTENQSHGKWRQLKAALMGSRAFRKLWLGYATRDYHAAYKKKSGDWASDYIVMDRYLMDFVIDQSLNFSMQPSEFMDFAKTSAIGRMQSPKFSIFISIPAEVGYERKLDGTPLHYLKEREALYTNLQLDNTLHINGEQPVEQIHRDITQWLLTKLELKSD